MIVPDTSAVLVVCIHDARRLQMTAGYLGRSRPDRTKVADGGCGVHTPASVHFGWRTSRGGRELLSDFAK